MLLLDGIKELPVDPLSPTVDLIELSSTQCKWPYDNLMCCGRVREIGKPYCSEHQRRAGRTTPKGPELGAFIGNGLGGKKKPKVRQAMVLLPSDID